MTNETRELFKKVVAEMFGEDEKSEPEVPTKSKDIDSFVTEEEFEAIKNLKEAFDNYVGVHNKCVFDNMEKLMTTKDPYAEAQYLMLQTVTNDLMKNIGLMFNVHTVDKATIDDLARDTTETDVNGFVAHLRLQLLEEKLGI